MILLDTNVLSELMRPEPEPTVVDWIAAQPSQGLFTTSITQDELLHGVLLLRSGKPADFEGCGVEILNPWDSL